MIDREKFFAHIRKTAFKNKMTEKQVAGCETILDEWERRKLTDLRHLAYMLGTTKYETAHTMQPIKEYGGTSYYKKMYDIEGSRPTLAKQNGNIHPGDGARYCGRGYVQLTWRDNYRKMGKLLNQPLEENPDLAMQPDIAAQIMFEGMIRGSFTGRALSDYFSATKTDWVQARRIINGIDKAATFAAVSQQFHEALVAAQTSPVIPVVKKTVAPTIAGAAAATSVGWFGADPVWVIVAAVLGVALWIGGRVLYDAYLERKNKTE